MTTLPGSPTADTTDQIATLEARLAETQAALQRRELELAAWASAAEACGTSN